VKNPRHFSSRIQANVEIKKSRVTLRVGIVVQVHFIFAFTLCGRQGVDNDFGEWDDQVDYGARPADDLHRSLGALLLDTMTFLNKVTVRASLDAVPVGS
jgi:hypothetical protein